MLLNGRYSDLERRVIDAFREALNTQPATTPHIFLPERLSLLVRFLVHDGLATIATYQSSMSMNFPDGTILRDDNIKLTLTAAGRAFIRNLERIT